MEKALNPTSDFGGMQTNPPEIQALRVSSDEPGEILHAMQSAQAVSLEQGWLEKPQSELTNTRVRVAWNPHALWVSADLQDRDIYTSAIADSQYLWELGDVFEIFLEEEAAGYYVEMHVAPNNFRLHLRFSPLGFIALRENKASIEDFVIRPPRFKSTVEITSNGWTVMARIPCEEISPLAKITPQSRWRASFCRYDAGNGRRSILSSTSAHAELSFHRRHEWRSLCF